eukprot:371636-Rhodomonas_salina.1
MKRKSGFAQAIRREGTASISESADGGEELCLTARAVQIHHLLRPQYPTSVQYRYATSWYPNIPRQSSTDTPGTPISHVSPVQIHSCLVPKYPSTIGGYGYLSIRPDQVAGTRVSDVSTGLGVGNAQDDTTCQCSTRLGRGQA